MSLQNKIYQNWLVKSNREDLIDSADGLSVTLNSLYKKFQTISSYIKFQKAFESDILPLVFSGFNVCLDVILLTIRDEIMLHAASNWFPNIKHILIYKDLETLFSNTEIRNKTCIENDSFDFRFYSQVARQYIMIHNFKVVVSKETPNQNASFGGTDILEHRKLDLLSTSKIQSLINYAYINDQKLIEHNQAATLPQIQPLGDILKTKIETAFIEKLFETGYDIMVLPKFNYDLVLLGLNDDSLMLQTLY